MAEPRRIVRIAGTDLDGTLAAHRALRKIHGVGWMTAKALCTVAGVDNRQKLGLFDDSQVKALETAVTVQQTQPTIPRWMENRRRDPDSGKDAHIVGDKLRMRNMEDINLMKRTRVYKGIRHELGLPARGQRTRSTGRKARTVGVLRKKVVPGAKPAAPAAAAGKAAAPAAAKAAPAAAKPAAAPAKPEKK